MQRTITTRAGRYRMNFYTTQRRNAGTGTQRLRFTVDGIEVNTVTPSSLPSYGWRSTLDFSLSAGSHTIRIQGLVTTGDETAFIDAVMLESVVWLHGDHLGSANLATGSNGVALTGSSQRYSPFGSPLVSGSGLPSKYTFTGQRSFMDFGLVEYGGGTRFYSPLLGRFTSADSIVPGAGNPQSLNRYSYVGNSPMSRVDPSGHADCAEGDNACWQSEWGWKNRWYEAHGYFWNSGANHWSTSGDARFADEGILNDTVGEAGISFSDALADWDPNEMLLIAQGIVALGNKVGGLAHLGSLLGGVATTFFRIRDGGILPNYGGTTTAFVGFGEVQVKGLQNFVTFLDASFTGSADFARGQAVHELAHIIDFHSRISIPNRGRTSGGIFSTALPDRFSQTTSTYGGKNALEYFAESVVDWVYGSRYRPSDGNRNPLTTNQADFLNQHLGGH